MLSFNLGPLAISISQVLIAIAFAVALLAGRLADSRRDAAAGDTLFTLAIIGVVSARIGFVAIRFTDYGLDPLAWIDVRDGGFHLIGGLIGIVVYATWRMRLMPALRRPLGAALVAGTLTWGLGSGALSLLNREASRLPEVSLQRLDGVPTDLVGLQRAAGNRPMVVNLWATWCPPCRAEMPVLAEAQSARPDVTFVFVNQREAVQAIERYLRAQGLLLENVVRDTGGQIPRAVGSAGLPTTLFYDGSGRLAHSHLGMLSKATLARAIEGIE